MIDFDALICGPAQAVFSRPITVTPKKSQGPSAPSYDARGIWASKPIDVTMLDNGIASSQMHTLDIRASEFEVPIVQGDEITIPAHLSMPRVGVCKVDDVDDDGHGGLTVTLKLMRP